MPRLQSLQTTKSWQRMPSTIAELSTLTFVIILFKKELFVTKSKRFVARRALFDCALEYANIRTVLQSTWMVEAERPWKTVRDIWKLIYTSYIVQSMRQLIHWRNGSIVMRTHVKLIGCLFIVHNIKRHRKLSWYYMSRTSLEPPFLYRDWKRLAWAVCYQLSCFSPGSFPRLPSKRDYLENFQPGSQYWDPS